MIGRLCLVKHFRKIERDLIFIFFGRSHYSVCIIKKLIGKQASVG